MSGGIKTVTFAVLLCACVAALRREDTVQVFRRRIDPRTINIALMVTMLAGFIVVLGFGALMFTELGRTASQTAEHWLGLAFEAVSAFGTVGLSAGATFKLNSAAQVIIIIVMFVGKFGPMTLMLFMAGREQPEKFKLAEEAVRIG